MIIEGEASHLLIGRQWEAILPERLLAQWHKFLPAGEINVRAMRLVFDGSRWRLDGVVDCLNVSFMFYKFPYRLDRGTGTLTLKSDSQTNQNRLLLNLTAYAGGRPVKIDGEFFNPGPEFTGGVELHGENVPFDQNLYAAMTAAQPKSSAVVQSLNPAGTFNFWVRNQRNDPQQKVMNQHLVVTLNRSTFCYDKFRYPMYNVTGTLEMIDGHWTFRDLAGTNHSGRVTGEGRLTPVPDGFDLFLQFRGHDIGLEEELRDALNPHMQRLWNELRPKGSFNLELCEVSYRSADKKLSVTTRVEPVGDSVSIEPTFFRYRLEKLQGSISFREGRANLENVRAIHERTSLTTGGYCEYTPDGNWHMRLENLAVDRLRLDRDRDLIAALPSRLRKAAERLNPTGLVGLSGAVDWWGNSPPPADPAAVPTPEDCKLRTAWNVEFDLQQAGLRRVGFEKRQRQRGAQWPVRWRTLPIARRIERRFGHVERLSIHRREGALLVGRSSGRDGFRGIKPIAKPAGSPHFGAGLRRHGHGRRRRQPGRNAPLHRPGGHRGGRLGAVLHRSYSRPPIAEGKN